MDPAGRAVGHRARTCRGIAGRNDDHADDHVDDHPDDHGDDDDEEDYIRKGADRARSSESGIR